jgi:hypothetical protein
MPIDIRPLIRDYLAATAAAVDDLRLAYPMLVNVLHRRQLGIPQGGTLPSGRTFWFHGIGCRFELNGVVVDMDFGSNGETDGFDAWRVYSFFKGQGCETKIMLFEVENALLQMLNAGELVRREGRSLYFFKA